MPLYSRVEGSNSARFAAAIPIASASGGSDLTLGAYIAFLDRRAFLDCAALPWPNYRRLLLVATSSGGIVG